MSKRSRLILESCPPADISMDSPAPDLSSPPLWFNNLFENGADSLSVDENDASNQGKAKKTKRLTKSQRDLQNSKRKFQTDVSKEITPLVVKGPDSIAELPPKKNSNVSFYESDSSLIEDTDSDLDNEPEDILSEMEIKSFNNDKGLDVASQNNSFDGKLTNKTDGIVKLSIPKQTISSIVCYSATSSDEDEAMLETRVIAPPAEKCKAQEVGLASSESEASSHKEGERLEITRRVFIEQQQTISPLPSEILYPESDEEESLDEDEESRYRCVNRPGIAKRKLSFGNRKTSSSDSDNSVLGGSDLEAAGLSSVPVPNNTEEKNDDHLVNRKNPAELSSSKREGSDTCRKVIADWTGDIPQFHFASDSENEEFAVATTATPVSDTARLTIEGVNSIEETPKNPRRKPRPKPASRKRCSQPSTWRINEAKEALNRGRAHETIYGKKREAKTMGPGCRETCTKCKDKQKFTPMIRNEIFQKFWDIGNHDLQWSFIAAHTHISTPKKKTAQPDSKKSKSVTRTYVLPVKRKEIQVCKTFFCHTLGVNDKWVRTALRKKSPEGIMEQDNRGRHDNRPTRASEETIKLVIDHINRIPRTDSHYVRERSKREYIDSTLSINQLYKLYKEEMDKNKTCPCASPHKYREIFVTQFNIGNFIPRKDQCAKCVKWKFSSVREKKEIALAHALHRQNRRIAHQMKRDAKERAMGDPSTCVACFDLEKVLPLPRTEVGDAFYLNKVSVLNCTFLDLALLEGICFLWTEVIANRGSNEIASNLYAYISGKAAQGVKTFHFFSDGPTGQNKNRQVFSMYNLASVQFQVSVAHTFLEPGHTYMEVDSMHALIEKRARRREIYDLSSWVTLMENAKEKGRSYKVNVLDQEHFLDFKPLVAQQNWEKDVNGEKIRWSKIKHIEVDCSVPNIVNFKYEFKGPTQSLNVNQRKGRPVNLSRYQVPRAYQDKIPLKGKKPADIKQMIDKGIIPLQYQEYYKSLLAIGAAAAETTGSG